jgi:hypothetical protein
VSSRRLELEDIADLRAYERGRLEFRRQIIAVKRRRRVALGALVTVVFESRETVLFQVQEMARAERMASDAQIQRELDIYNTLVPSPGELSATLFVELTDEQALRTWLPRLVGVERCVEVRLGTEPDIRVVRCLPEEAHDKALTRPEATSAVHYIRFAFDARDVEAFAVGPVTLRVVHPEYCAETLLSDQTRSELLADLRD